jgi:hypothetical protein
MSFDKAKLFSTKALHERSVSACGETFTVHVRRLPAVDLARFHAEVLSPDISVRARAGFEALSKSIRNSDGSAFATLDDYNRMDADAISGLMKAFTEVNARNADPELGNA